MRSRSHAGASRLVAVKVAIAACVAIALVIGGVLLFARRRPVGAVPTVPPTAHLPGACAGKAYVKNQGDTVSVITLATGAVSAPITVGGSPGGLAVTPDGKHVYVANPGNSITTGTVSVINTATGAVSRPSPSAAARRRGDHPGRRSRLRAKRRLGHRVGDRHGHQHRVGDPIDVGAIRSAGDHPGRQPRLRGQLPAAPCR